MQGRKPAVTTRQKGRKMVVYESDLKKNAISAMENCRAFVLNGDMTRAHYYRGMARAYEEMLEDEGVSLSESNSYYADMVYHYRKAVQKEKEIRG